MTLQELYAEIDGDYEKAMRVLRIEKLMDKHIRKLPKSGVIDNLVKAADDMDPTQLFEYAHAAKGMCANLGLTKISDAASEIAEEFRPGNSRKLSDDEVKAKLAEIGVMYEKTADGIRRYEEA